MYRFLTPILAFIVSITLFFTFIEPTFNRYKQIDLEILNYKAAVDDAGKLQERVEKLKAEKEAINIADMSRLMDFLPDSVDEVAVVLILDKLATAHSLVIEGIKVKSTAAEGSSGGAGQSAYTFADDEKNANAEVIGADGTVVRKPQDNLETTALSFSVTGEYENFRSFVADLEKSLALIDISTLAIQEASEGEFASYDMGLTMYSFKPNEN